MSGIEMIWETILGTKSIEELEEELRLSEEADEEEAGLVSFEEFAGKVLAAGAEAVSFEAITAAEADRRLADSVIALFGATGMQDYERSRAENTDRQNEDSSRVLRIVVFAPLVPNAQKTYAIMSAVGEANVKLWETLGERPRLNYANTVRESFAKRKEELQRACEADPHGRVIALAVRV